MRPRSFQRSIDAEQGARRPAPLVDIGGREDLLQQPELVVGVEDREARLEPDRLGVAAQDARGDRMKRAEPDAFGGAADHRLEPLAHLARRLVGEGDGEQLAGIGAAGRQDMREPGGQHPGLAGAGAGQHQHRPVDRLDGPRCASLSAANSASGSIGRRVAGSDDAGHADMI